jgi:hypothetical protein
LGEEKKVSESAERERRCRRMGEAGKEGLL